VADWREELKEGGVDGDRVDLQENLRPVGAERREEFKEGGVDRQDKVRPVRDEGNEELLVKGRVDWQEKFRPVRS
jgi:hypothetical protein